MTATGKTISTDEEQWITDDSEDDDEIGEAVAKAHQLDNPLALDKLAPLRVTAMKNGVQASLEHFRIDQISSEHFKWIIDLMTRNMKSMYKKTATGWKPKAKRKEMSQDTSRYLVAFVENKPVAFSHFQFDMDYGRQVLYCYEIQVEADFRSCGLGKLVIGALEKIAKHANLPLVVLTVFKFNLPSLSFFKSLGYNVDETCPGEEEEKDYVILSKKVVE